MWKPPDNQLLPWMQSLSKRLGSLGLPNLHGESLWIVSDYVFGNPNSRFDVVSVLLAVPEKSVYWRTQMELVRQNWLGEKRRMSFKALGDKVRQEAFVPFLQAADRIHGLVVTVAIDRHLSDTFAFGKHEAKNARESEMIDGDWKEKSLSRMMTVSQVMAFLVAGLSGEGQDLYWISDQDEIFANTRLSMDTGNVFTKCLSAYSSHEYGEIAIGTTAITEADLVEEDLAAIADIAAGGTVELLSSVKGEHDKIPGIAIEVAGLPTRTVLFHDWFQYQKANLKKVGCIFEQHQTALRVSTWR